MVGEFLNETLKNIAGAEREFLNYIVIYEELFGRLVVLRVNGLSAVSECRWRRHAFRVQLPKYFNNLEMLMKTIKWAGRVARMGRMRIALWFCRTYDNFVPTSQATIAAMLLLYGDLKCAQTRWSVLYTELYGAPSIYY